MKNKRDTEKLVSAQSGRAIVATDNDGSNWLPVIARSLAYLCLKQARLDDKPMLDRAKFLNGLGLPRSEAAGLLGTTPASLAELQRQANKRKKPSGGKRSGARKKS